MKECQKSNMLYATAEAVLEEFSAYVTANPNASLLCVSSEALSEDARSAIVASAERLGYGRDNVAWVVVVAGGEGADKAAATDKNSLATKKSGAGEGEVACAAADGDDLPEADELAMRAEAARHNQTVGAAKEAGANVPGREGQKVFFATAVSNGAAALSESDVRTIIEGLDPVALVVADSAAAALVAEAYKQPLFCDHPCRLAARSVAAFSNFESLMATPESKQKAWALLKELSLG